MMAKREQIHIVATSSAPPDALYTLLIDGRTWVDWSGLDECVPEGLGSCGEEQVGTMRLSKRGRTVGRDRLTELVPNRRLGYEHVEGLPVEDYQASVSLTPNTDGGTTIVWNAAFSPRWPGTGGLLRRGVTRFLSECAHGLAARAEES